MEANNDPRFHMWCELLSEHNYIGLDKNEKKKMKKAFATAAGCMPHEISTNIATDGALVESMADRLHTLRMAKNLSLDCCKAIQETKPGGQWIGCPVPTRNDDMYVSQDVTVTEKNDASQTKSYFLRRIQDVESEKTREAYKTYGFEGLSRSMTPNELIARIKSDAFTLETDEADDETYDVLDAFTWTTVKKDRKGYEAFQRGLSDLVASTKDAIWAETDFSKLPGLVAAFKAATVTPVTLN